jgi:hypothetical protein
MPAALATPHGAVPKTTEPEAAVPAQPQAKTGMRYSARVRKPLLLYLPKEYVSYSTEYTAYLQVCLNLSSCPHKFLFNFPGASYPMGLAITRLCNNPKTYNKAMALPNAVQRRAGMDAKIAALKGACTWKVVPSLATSCHVIGSK